MARLRATDMEEMWFGESGEDRRGAERTQKREIEWVREWEREREREREKNLPDRWIGFEAERKKK
jgi:hypothetical protein